MQWPLGSPGNSRGSALERRPWDRSSSSARTRTGGAPERRLGLGHDGAPERTAWGQYHSDKPRTPSVTEPAPWVASYRKRRASPAVREPRVPNHAGYDDEVAALSRRSIVERLEGWTDDGYTPGLTLGM